MYVDFWSEGIAERLERKEEVSGIGEPCADADGGTARRVLVLAEGPVAAPRAAPAAEESIPKTPAAAPAWTAGAAEVRAAGMAKRESRSEA